MCQHGHSSKYVPFNIKSNCITILSVFILIHLCMYLIFCVYVIYLHSKYCIFPIDKMQIKYINGLIWQNPVSTKNIKISWAQWHIPVIPATWEAEAGESLEPGRQRLQ